MRLTLRTLLAYLDDTLDPAQARQIGQKIAESEQARDLIERIQQITRRRRIANPPVEGPGAMLDANTLGEYLDNVSTPEQAAEIEEIFLTSDNHLAEIAACHQVLSLILSEPALVPPSAKQRMYGLVKGPEAIPFRKPPASAWQRQHDDSDGRDEDETLRLGLPPVGGRHRGNPLWIIVAGAAAACLVLVAAWQVLKTRDEPVSRSTPDNQTLVTIQPDQVKPPPEAKQEPENGKKDPMAVPEPPVKVEPKDPLEIKLPPVVIDLPWTSPSADMKPIGKLLADAKDPPLLLAFAADTMEWRRIHAKNPEVLTGQPLVSMPAAKSTIELSKGLTLTLVGNVPELYFPPPLIFESAVELHAQEHFDLDLTLRRGRIRILAAARPARLRIRFGNPTRPQQHEYFDITLQNPGTEVLIERWFAWPGNEKFFRDPKALDRIGPMADMSCFVLSGTALFKHQEVARTLTAPPGEAQAYWNSLKGLDKPFHFDKVPEGLKSPLQPADWDGRIRTDALRARDELHQRLTTKAVDVVLTEALKAPEPALRRLACRCLGATDDLAALFEQMEQESDHELRLIAIDTLHYWIAIDRDNDYKLVDVLKAKYRPFEAETVMTLLHGFGDKAAKSPATFDMLIGYLNHPRLPVRELAHLRLLELAPAGQKIRYSAVDLPTARQQAQNAWRQLAPATPPPPPPAPLPKSS